MKPPTCPYCTKKAVLVDSVIIYGTSYGNVWICPDFPKCDSYVGVHKSTNRPLGRMANRELREARKAAHAVFDKLWKGVDKYRDSRIAAYEWLAKALNLHPDECHIGMFDVEMCKKVIEVCKGKS